MRVARRMHAGRARSRVLQAGSRLRRSGASHRVPQLATDSMTMDAASSASAGMQHPPLGGHNLAITIVWHMAGAMHSNHQRPSNSFHHDRNAVGSLG